MVGGADGGEQLLDCDSRVAVYGDGRSDGLVELRGVDVDMNYLGVGGIEVGVAGDAVVEAHADGDDDVSAVGVVIDAYVAVHAEHTFI